MWKEYKMGKGLLDKSSNYHHEVEKLPRRVRDHKQRAEAKEVVYGFLWLSEDIARSF